MSLGLSLTVSVSLEQVSAPLVELSVNTQPSFASPLDQFCMLVATDMLWSNNSVIGKLPSAVALREPVPSAPSLVQLTPVLRSFQVTWDSVHPSVS